MQPYICISEFSIVCDFKRNFYSAIRPPDVHNTILMHLPNTYLNRYCVVEKCNNNAIILIPELLYQKCIQFQIDKCNRLWVMDTGKIGATQHCTPQLMAFDLKDDRLLYRYRFSESLYTAQSLFITPVSAHCLFLINAH